MDRQLDSINISSLCIVNDESYANKIFVVFMDFYKPQKFSLLIYFECYYTHKKFVFVLVKNITMIYTKIKSSEPQNFSAA